jgi:hypothetical protein
VGHVLHFGASRARNVDAVFSMLGWGQYGLNKKRAGTRYANLVFLRPVESAGHVVHSGASGSETSMHRPIQIQQKGHRDMFHSPCVFPTGAGHVLHSGASGA